MNWTASTVDKNCNLCTCEVWCWNKAQYIPKTLKMRKRIRQQGRKERKNRGREREKANLSNAPEWQAGWCGRAAKQVPWFCTPGTGTWDCCRSRLRRRRRLCTRTPGLVHRSPSPVTKKRREKKRHSITLIRNEHVQNTHTFTKISYSTFPNYWTCLCLLILSAYHVP